MSMHVCADTCSGIRCLCQVEVTETSRAGLLCTSRVTHCRIHSMANTKDPSMLRGAHTRTSGQAMQNYTYSGRGAAERSMLTSDSIV